MFRLSCDSLVALSNATADGSVLFAKNSDRPAHECQPLFLAPRQTHPPHTRLHCTYIDIPQVSETARVIGSRPCWIWGFEHGLNEHGVAIGNHTVFTKDPLETTGLIGMDLVRLGLERGRSAAQALEVMTGLVPQYGQGGSGIFGKHWPYHNSFLIADRATAFILDTSGREWATRRVSDVASVSNHLTIGSDWDGLSDGAIEHAITHGWWSEESDERFDFAAAYRDTTVVPEVISSGRHQRSCALLEHAKGALSMAALKRALRDHYGESAAHGARTPADPRYFSICMHAEPVGTTTASMIARIPSDATEPLVYWASLGSPCISAFVPLYVDCDIPAALTRGGEHASDDSLWWRCHRLLTVVEQDWDRAERVRRELDQFEAQVTERMRNDRLATAGPHERSAFVNATVADLTTRIAMLLAELTAEHSDERRS